MGLPNTVLALPGLLVAFVVFHFLSRAWRKRSLRNIPGPASVSWISGNFPQFFGHAAIPFHDEELPKYGRIVRMNGLLGDQFLVISDTKALYEVLVKRQDIFEEPEYFTEWAGITIGRGLLGTRDEVHRKQRKLMNPAFSINHMRRMIPVFQSLTLQLQNIMRKEIGKEWKEVDALNYMGRLALELISQAGMGHSVGALEEKDDDYAIALKSLAPASAHFQGLRMMLPLLTHNFSPKVLRWMLERAPWRIVRELKSLCDTVDGSARSIWEEKKTLYARGDKSVVNEHGEGKDLMSILLKENFEATESDRMTDEELVGQMNTFLFAGTDTTSNALARILHLLALHPDVQDTLRAELVEAGGASGQLGYDQLIELPFLEAVCRETLRLYPPVYVIQRASRRDHVLPLARPYTDVNGVERSEVFLPSGTTVFVNITGVNRDPETWGPDARVWRPARWLEPLPSTVADARIPGVYANTLTFAAGGRACIGFKFSQLEMKVALSQLVPTFRFAPSKKQEVVWRFGGIVTPSVKGSTTSKPEMPLRMSLVQE